MKNKKLIFLVIVSLLFVLSVGVTYAYFEYVFDDGDGAKNITVTTGSLLLEYIDGQEIVGNNISPGWTTTKTFTVENKSSIDAYYTIDWKNLINDVENNEMKLSATCVSSYEGSNEKICAGIDRTVVASSPNNIKGQTFIAPGFKHTYELTLTFEEISSEQNYNQGKTFIGVININDIKGEEYTWNLELLALTLDGASVTSLPRSGNFVLSSYACENGEKLQYDTTTHKLSLESVTVDPVGCSLNFVSADSLNTTISQKVYADNTKLPSRSDFSTAITTNTTGNIYYTSEKTESVCDSSDTLTYVSGSGDDSVCKTFYFAGNTQNNYLSLGGFMWRIIRINEDESLRMIYQGNLDNSFTALSGYSAIGISYSLFGLDDNRQIDYYYGNSCSSYETCHSNTTEQSIAGAIKTWYLANLSTYYNRYFSKTAIYCNDRSFIGDTGGYGSIETYYSAYDRLVTHKNPQFKCPDIIGDKYGNLSGTDNNKFTVSDTTGNGDLLHPIALMTADESIFAGANDMGLDSSTQHYLKDYATWASTYTMTPMKYESNIGYVSRINLTGSFILKIKLD